jgi:uncharacterized protein (TIGR02246 family)
MAGISERAEFERQAADYLAAFNSGDYEKVASYWTEDAVSCPPVGEEIRGRAALREFYRQFFAGMAPRLSDYSFECDFSEGVIFVRESWMVTMNPPGQEPQGRRGRGLWVGRKGADGVWRTFWSLARLEA